MSRVIPFPVAELVHDQLDAVAPPVPLHEAVSASRRRHRRLVAAAGLWALARGLPLPADHVALWAAAAEWGRGYGAVDGLTGPWSSSELNRLLRDTVSDWCAGAGCDVPADLPQSLWYLYGFLADTGRLHPGSDSLPELRAVLALAAQSGNRLRFPPPKTPPEPTAA